MLLVLILLVPLVCGLVCLLIRSRRLLERLNLGAFLVLAGLALELCREVLRNGTLQALNGFLFADAFSALVVGLTAFVSLACGIYAIGYFRQDESRKKITLRQLRLYYVLTPLFVTTMLLVPLAHNLGVMWVAIESTTLASVLLVTF
jgi:hydrogenase-4 component F